MESELRARIETITAEMKNKLLYLRSHSAMERKITIPFPPLQPASGPEREKLESELRSRIEAMTAGMESLAFRGAL